MRPLSKREVTKYNINFKKNFPVNYPTILNLVYVVLRCLQSVYSIKLFMGPMFRFHVQKDEKFHRIGKTQMHINFIYLKDGNRSNVVFLFYNTDFSLQPSS